MMTFINLSSPKNSGRMRKVWAIEPVLHLRIIDQAMRVWCTIARTGSDNTFQNCGNGLEDVFLSYANLGTISLYTQLGESLSITSDLSCASFDVVT